MDARAGRAAAAPIRAYHSMWVRQVVVNMHSVLRCARALALVALVCCARAQAAADFIEATTEALDEAVPGEYNGDVRDLPPVYTPRPYLFLNEFEAPPDQKPKRMASAPILASAGVLAPMPSPTTNFAGLGFSTSVTGGQAGGGWPPDTNGDVGPTYYIQSVNTAFGIFSKSTGALAASFTENQLWSAATFVSGPCKTENAGDPVVLHDAVNDRWILTDFAFAVSGTTPVAPFYECIAVSKSSDPVSGGWWFYAVRMDPGGTGKPASGLLADYPKFGLWNDGCLYMATNEFDPTLPSSQQYQGAAFASFNTADMYAGATLRSSLGFLSGSSNDAFTMIPSNALGVSAASMPPANTPNYFVSESGTAFGFNVRKFTKGANCGAGGTMSAPVLVSQSSYAFNSSEYVPQKGTGNLLDPLEDRVMQKVQYRKIGSVESLWVVHTTGDGSTAPAQPQWAQINVTGGTIVTTPVQQQIYAPDTTKSRWMASLAVDASGDMAMGYSYSSSADFPGIRYAGRLVGDALNQLPQTEVQLVAGLSSQNSCSDGGGAGCTTSRWGDYSSMSIDPSDDCTFWYTNEYYGTASNNGEWQTRIGSFKFPTCTNNVPTKLAFTTQPSSSYASGATITVKVSVENAAGAVVTTDTSAITLVLQGGTAGATLSGTTTVNAVAGVATFSLSVDKVGSAYKLHATDGSLTTADSSTFNITAGGASKLKFTTQPPASVQAGAAFGAVVEVEDAAGNRVTTNSSTVTLNLFTGTCAGLTGNTMAASSGIATFSSLKVATIGTGCSLRATDAGFTPDTSTTFSVIVGPPASTVFTTQPSAGQNIAAGTTFSVAAQVKDSTGNVIAGDSVTLAVANNPGSSTLAVTTNPLVTNSSGSVTFSGVSLNKAGSGYTFKVTEATGANTATSNAFNIVPGAPAKLVFTTQPTDITPPSALNPVAVTEQDASGNTVTSDSTTNVSFSVSACSGTTLGSATMSSGVATFSGTSFTQTRDGLKITANASSSSVTSQSFNIGPADGIFVDGYETCAL